MVTRFAPSPTGDLHLGHAYSAAFAASLAQGTSDRFLVRIEDIDRGRCRDAFIRRNLEDLHWLGLRWQEPVLRQSTQMHRYKAALASLGSLGVTYFCFCTRKQIRDEIAAAADAPQAGAKPSIYPGTCRKQDPSESAARIARGDPYAVRLASQRAYELTGELTWIEDGQCTQHLNLSTLGDVVIARKEMETSYHLAVVVDDAAQGVTHVTRGVDLFDATHVHRLLYALLGLNPPVWRHHPLCCDASGRRFAKRDKDLTIRVLRERGLSPADVLALAEEATNLDGPRSC
ncbi:MAG: tRNA glutamyl-Q(34) synthetase GluQRS [Rhodospirillales bacterium]|nr:tRNA glutamyl-Q(34) synthetase GluQRS [Rhodospirillales bacterium]